MIMSVIEMCKCAQSAGMWLDMHVDPENERIPGSDPADPDPGFLRIVDAPFVVCWQIHGAWGHIFPPLQHG